MKLASLSAPEPVHPTPKKNAVLSYEFTRTLPPNLHLRHRQQPNQPLTPSKQWYMVTNPRHPPKQQPWY